MGLLHQEADGKILTEDQFVQAISFSSVLPGSEAEKLAMFIGLRVDGLPGRIDLSAGRQPAAHHPDAGCLYNFAASQREAWLTRFVQGLLPAVAVLMVYVAYGLLSGGKNSFNWPVLAVAAVSFVAFLFDVPPPLVLIACGARGNLFLQMKSPGLNVEPFSTKLPSGFGILLELFWIFLRPIC